MQSRNITAGQLAVTYQGRLVLARGYAWTDDSTLNVSPTSLFRIASLSKPITAAAVTRLVQDDELSLSTPFTSLPRFTPPAAHTVDPRLSDVTVGRLLQHLGGWDSSLSGDPTSADHTVAQTMGVTLPVSQNDVIRFGLARPLNHAPGTTYAYSNYGYLLAGRIIEAISRQSYFGYVQENLLRPLGITRMKLGRSTIANRAASEVPYFSQYVGSTVMDTTGAAVPYPDGAFNLENIDSAGGWLSTAVDLVRFAAVFDNNPPVTVLNSTSLSHIFAPPETGLNSDGSFYGLGWMVRPISGGAGHNTWHVGSLPGTYTLLVRTNDGMSWAVLFDQRDDASGLDYSSIDPLLWSAARAVTTWPAANLFPTYLD